MTTPTRQHFFRVPPDDFAELTFDRQHAVIGHVDLGIEVGDQLVLREWRETGAGGRGEYTGVWICRKVTHLIAGGLGTGIEQDYAVLSLNDAVDNDFATKFLRRKLALAERGGMTSDRFWQVQQAQAVRQAGVGVAMDRAAMDRAAESEPPADAAG